MTGLSMLATFCRVTAVVLPITAITLAIKWRRKKGALKGLYACFIVVCWLWATADLINYHKLSLPAWICIADSVIRAIRDIPFVIRSTFDPNYKKR